jgi:protein-tyrosine phosphatase
MIDLHAHILPELDDGPASLEESLDMARIATENGISIMVATPHSLNGVFYNPRKKILKACASLNAALQESKIALTILPGSEAHLSPEIIDDLENGRLMTLNDANKFLFLELPDHFTHRAGMTLIKHLLCKNITPIIVHPERNVTIQKSHKVIKAYFKAGAKIQITGASLWGEFGPEALNCSKILLKDGLVHFIASDSHSPDSRPPDLKRAEKILETLVGKKQAYWMVSEAPRQVVDGHAHYKSGVQPHAIPASDGNKAFEKRFGLAQIPLFFMERFGFVKKQF